MKRFGFTLVELLVVIAIIGLLSTVAVVSLSSSRDKARYAKIVSDLIQIGKAAEVYYSDNGFYPGDNSPGLMPIGLSPYMATFPSPPCSGWSYDYENWNAGETIETHVYNGSVYNFYHCIYSTGGANACGGGNEITSYAAKTITCDE